MENHDYDAFNRFMRAGWYPVQKPRHYRCGWCARNVSSDMGLQNYPAFVSAIEVGEFASDKRVETRICNFCSGATTFLNNRQFPASLLGDNFKARPGNDDLAVIVQLYDEARHSLSQGGASCAVLMFRKLLMHIAVQQGAEPGLNFVKYVDYLQKESVVGRPQFPILIRIKDAGNQENHEVRRATDEEAQDLLDLVTLLIRSVYPEAARRE